jgi:hypothetical protein
MSVEEPKRRFSLEEAQRVLPEIRKLTQDSFEQMTKLTEEARGAVDRGESEAKWVHEVGHILTFWTESVESLGGEVKGLWLVDFDCGHGYYCWKYPEEALAYYHSYEDGFTGRIHLV